MNAITKFTPKTEPAAVAWGQELKERFKFRVSGFGKLITMIFHGQTILGGIWLCRNYMKPETPSS